MRSNAATTEVVVRLADEMEAFDALPRELRDALNNAAGCYAAHEVRYALRNGATIPTIIAAIDLKDRLRALGLM